MKYSLFAFYLLLCTLTSFAQETVVVDEIELRKMAEGMERAAINPKTDPESKKQLESVAEVFKKSEGIELEVKKDKSKSEVIITKIGRKVGRGSAFITTATAKPFLSVAGFFTGLFEKKENENVIGVYNFFLNNSESFDGLCKDSGTPEEFIEVVLAQMDEAVENKSNIIFKDLLLHLGITRPLPDRIEEFELTAEELASLDLSKLDPDFINNHPEYQDLKPLLGEMTKEKLEEIVFYGYFDRAINFDDMQAALPKVYEGAAALYGQILVPKMTLGLVSNSLAGLYAAPVIGADVGTAISTAVCLQETTQEKFKQDKDLKSFCSYVVNRTGYQLIKSRAKGYVAGKKFKSKIKQKREERRTKRNSNQA